MFRLCTFAQTNNPAPYCAPAYAAVPCNLTGPSNTPGNIFNDFINNFITTGAVVNINNPNSGCNGMPNNYIYYCQHNLQVNPGSVITCSLMSGITYAHGFAIFIDWNSDNIFQTPSELVTFSPGVVAPATWCVINFNVPSNQTQGIYRMRVRAVYSANGNAITPCANYSHGECEDYNVYVGMAAPSLPSVSSTATSNSPICTGNSISLSANSSSATSFYWTGPLSYTSNVQNPILTNATTSMSGTYYVAVTSGSCPVMASTYVQVNTGTAPSLTISSNANPVCIGSSASLSLSSIGAFTYTWSTGSTINTTSVTPTVTTVYSVTGNNNFCNATAFYTQSVTTSPTVIVTGNNNTICAGNSVTLTASGADNYSWTPGGTGTSITVSPTLTTTYSITGTNTTCAISGTTTFTQTVTICTNLSETNLLLNNLIVYPNPFKHEFKVQINGTANICIHDQLGKLILTVNVVEEKIIDTHSFLPGIYFVSFKENGRSGTVKLIKN